MPFLLNVATRLLDIVFPQVEASGRRNLGAELMSGSHVPLPVAHDHILESLNGSALFAYRDAHIRAAIHSLKYEGNTDVAAWFADRAEDAIARIIAQSNGKRVVVVPIPVSLGRHLERGYNQSALLAQAISRRFPEDLVYDETFLTRSAFVQSQTKARTRIERAKNIKGAFEANNTERVRGSHTLVVDDVITTGATIREASRVLLGAGACSVRCFAIAH